MKGKRIRRLCLALAAASALLSACGSAKRTALPHPEQRKHLEDRPLAEAEPEDTERMTALNCAGRALLTKDALYTMDFDSEHKNVLARYSRSDGSLSERTVLAGDCVPKWLTLYEGRIYYINALAGDVLESVGINGEDRRVEVNEQCSYLQVYASALYYCDSAGRLSRRDAQGGAAQTVIDEACAYPLLLDGAVIYQAQGRGEVLCLRWLSDGTELLFTDSPAYAPVIVGDRLYYTQEVNGDNYLCGMRIDGTDGVRYTPSPINGAAEYVRGPDGSFSARYFTDTDRLRQWSAALGSLGDGELLDSYGYRLCDCADGGYRVDAAYQLDGSIRCFILVSPDGSETEYLYGKVK